MYIKNLNACVRLYGPDGRAARYMQHGNCRGMRDIQAEMRLLISATRERKDLERSLALQAAIRRSKI